MKNRFENVFAVNKNTYETINRQQYEQLQEDWEINNKKLIKQRSEDRSMCRAVYEINTDRFRDCIKEKDEHRRAINGEQIDYWDIWETLNDLDYVYKEDEDKTTGLYNAYLEWIGMLISTHFKRKVLWSTRYFTLTDSEELVLNPDALINKEWVHNYGANQIASMIIDEIEKETKS